MCEISQDIFDEIDKKRIINFMKYKTIYNWMNITLHGGSLKEQLSNDNIKRIVLYGATEFASLFIKQCENEGIDIVAISDKKITKIGGDYLGIPLVPPKVLGSMNNITVIITPLEYYEQIRDELKELEVEDVVSIEDLFHKR